MQDSVIRIFDFLLSLFGLLLASPLLLVLIAIGYLDTGSPIFFQQRVGRFGKPFTLIKLRTMRLDTESVASHLVGRTAITQFGRILRRTKLDELPQLLNVLAGDMSLVGPRPCLFSQTQLIGERERRGVFLVRPGITGVAQLGGVDMSTPELLSELDAKMISELSVGVYFSLIIATLMGGGSGDAVSK